MESSDHPQIPPLHLGRKAYSRAMAVGLSKAADEEARAEVEVLNSRLEKTRQLNLKISASLGRLESNGKSMADAIGPIYGNTQRLQTYANNIDGILEAISRIRQPAELKSNEEDIIRKGPEKAGLQAFLSSVKRLNGALADMNRTNLRSNQQAVSDLNRLLKAGNSQLETYFAKILQDDSRPIEPLSYITKEKAFPGLKPDITNRLGLINNHISQSTKQFGGESPLLQVYASVRGPYLISTLQNLSSASVNTARKKTPDSVYRKDTNSIGSYAKGMEGAFLAEYTNIAGLFSREEWGRVFNLTCQGAVSELARTLRDLNTHIKSNLNTDCFLAYEIIEIMSTLSASLESRTGELKNSFANALKPIKETGKLSLADLLDDTRRSVSSLQTLPQDGKSVQITMDTMTRLQTMVDFLPPISSIMISIGDGGWKTNAASNSSTEQIPSLASFDVTADGKQIFAHYCVDTINTLMSSLEQKSKVILKGNQALPVFLLNNVTIINGMIRSSDLQPLLSSHMADIEVWQKKEIGAYSGAWGEAARQLLDVQYTSGSRQRPTSNANDSATILKSLSSKDKDAIKEKFSKFNTIFDELVQKHKSLHMEREVRAALSRSVQGMIESLYCRFWDRYHEIDKGRGKYVKYTKPEISGVFISLG